MSLYDSITIATAVLGCLIIIIAQYNELRYHKTCLLASSCAVIAALLEVSISIERHFVIFRWFYEHGAYLLFPTILTMVSLLSAISIVSYLASLRGSNQIRKRYLVLCMLMPIAFLAQSIVFLIMIVSTMNRINGHA